MASRYHFGQSRPSLGETIGSALGTGLGRGLTAVAETKLNSMISRQRQAADKQKLVSLGIPDHEAEFLSHQDAETQWQAARAWLVAGGAPDDMLPRQLGQPFNITPEQEIAARQQMQPEVSPQQKAFVALDELEAQGKRPQTAADLLTQEGPLSPHIKEAFSQTKIQRPSAMEALAPKAPQLPVTLSQQTQQPIPEPVVTSRQEVIQQQRPRSIGEAFKIAGTKPGDSSKQAALAAKEQQAINKSTEPFVKEIRGGYKAAKNSNVRLNRMEELIEKGNLSYPLTSSLVKTATKGLFGHGIDLTSLLTEDTQEFDKISTDFLKDAKAIFGSRITDVDLQNFLKTVPTSTMSDEGKRRVIRDLKIFNEAAILRDKVMKNIIDEYGGRRPANLEDLVEQRAEPQLEVLADKFKKGDVKREELARKNARKGLYTSEERKFKPFSGM